MEFTTIEVTGERCLEVLSERRSRFAATGEYPFLIGDAESVGRLKELAEFINKQHHAEFIRASFDVRVSDWLEAKQRVAEQDGFSYADSWGEWPSEVIGNSGLTLATDILTGKLRPVVLIGLAQIEQPWQLPAKLRYGNWNDCPSAEIHCAFHREWQERFGAEIVGASEDTIECIVANPPQDRDQAMTVAWEQYLYCTDIVDQGVGTISKLAATLMNSHYWYFWWD